MSYNTLYGFHDRLQTCVGSRCMLVPAQNTLIALRRLFKACKMFSVFETYLWAHTLCGCTNCWRSKIQMYLPVRCAAGKSSGMQSIAVGFSFWVLVLSISILQVTDKQPGRFGGARVVVTPNTDYLTLKTIVYMLSTWTYRNWDMNCVSCNSWLILHADICTSQTRPKWNQRGSAYPCQ